MKHDGRWEDLWNKLTCSEQCEVVMDSMRHVASYIYETMSDLPAAQTTKWTPPNNDKKLCERTAHQ